MLNDKMMGFGITMIFLIVLLIILISLIPWAIAPFSTPKVEVERQCNILFDTNNSINIKDNCIIDGIAYPIGIDYENDIIYKKQYKGEYIGK